MTLSSGRSPWCANAGGRPRARGSTDGVGCGGGAAEQHRLGARRAAGGVAASMAGPRRGVSARRLAPHRRRPAGRRRAFASGSRRHVKRMRGDVSHVPVNRLQGRRAAAAHQQT